MVFENETKFELGITVHRTVRPTREILTSSPQCALLFAMTCTVEHVACFSKLAGAVNKLFLLTLQCVAE